jgi:hypothetical protein
MVKSRLVDDMATGERVSNSKHLHSHRRIGMALALMVVASGVTLSLTSSHSAAPKIVQPSAQFLASARNALVRYLSHDGAPVAALAGPPKSTTSTSFNWSGYADVTTASARFSAISGSWTTPSVTCTAEDQLTSEWVGLDGFKSKTVEQDGTLGWCFQGHATYFTWYEMYPAGSIAVGRSLQPGDQITASVSRKAPTTYTLSVTDLTHPANSFTKTATCPAKTCLDTSAEWIAERPSLGTGITPLADFSTWNLAAGTATKGTVVGTISSFNPVQLGMIDSTKTYALVNTSSLTTNNAFSVTWINSF